jgi:hypothetical protein
VRRTWGNRCLISQVAAFPLLTRSVWGALINCNFGGKWPSMINFINLTTALVCRCWRSSQALFLLIQPVPLAVQASSQMIHPFNDVHMHSNCILIKFAPPSSPSMDQYLPVPHLLNFKCCTHWNWLIRKLVGLLMLYESLPIILAKHPFKLLHFLLSKELILLGPSLIVLPWATNHDDAWHTQPVLGGHYRLHMDLKTRQALKQLNQHNSNKQLL